MNEVPGPGSPGTDSLRGRASWERDTFFRNFRRSETLTYTGTTEGKD